MDGGPHDVENLVWIPRCLARIPLQLGSGSGSVYLEIWGSRAAPGSVLCSVSSSVSSSLLHVRRVVFVVERGAWRGVVSFTTASSCRRVVASRWTTWRVVYYSIVVERRPSTTWRHDVRDGVACVQLDGWRGVSVAWSVVSAVLG